jgi:hypothetical protein
MLHRGHVRARGSAAHSLNELFGFAGSECESRSGMTPTGVQKERSNDAPLPSPALDNGDRDRNRQDHCEASVGGRASSFARWPTSLNTNACLRSRKQAVPVIVFTPSARKAMSIGTQIQTHSLDAHASLRAERSNLQRVRAISHGRFLRFARNDGLDRGIEPSGLLNWYIPAAEGRTPTDLRCGQEEKTWVTGPSPVMTRGTRVTSTSRPRQSRQTRHGYDLLA